MLGKKLFMHLIYLTISIDCSKFCRSSAQCLNDLHSCYFYHLDYRSKTYCQTVYKKSYYWLIQIILNVPAEHMACVTLRKGDKFYIPRNVLHKYSTCIAYIFQMHRQSAIWYYKEIILNFMRFSNVSVELNDQKLKTKFILENCCLEKGPLIGYA